MQLDNNIWFLLSLIDFFSVTVSEVSFCSVINYAYLLGYKSSKIPRFQISSKTRQAQVWLIFSLFLFYNKKINIFYFQRYEELLAKPDYGSGQRLSRSRNGIKIKRILLTRKYRHTNVYHGKNYS